MTDRVPSGRSFTTITAVVAYLTEQGYKIGKTAVYGHYHKQLLRKRKNGTFALEDVDRYAAANLQRLDGSAVTEADAHLAEIQRKKAEVELDRATSEAELSKLKLDSRRRDLVTGPVEQAITARLIVFKSDRDNFIYSRAPALIASCNGDQSRAPEFIALFLTASDAWFERYASGISFTIDESGAVSPPFGTPRPADRDDLDELDSAEDLAS